MAAGAACTKVDGTLVKAPMITATRYLLVRFMRMVLPLVSHQMGEFIAHELPSSVCIAFVVRYSSAIFRHRDQWALGVSNSWHIGNELDLKLFAVNWYEGAQYRPSRRQHMSQGQ